MESLTVNKLDLDPAISTRSPSPHLRSCAVRGEYPTAPEQRKRSQGSVHKPSGATKHQMWYTPWRGCFHWRAATGEGGGQMELSMRSLSEAEAENGGSPCQLGMSKLVAGCA